MTDDVVNLIGDKWIFLITSEIDLLNAKSYGFLKIRILISTKKEIKLNWGEILIDIYRIPSWMSNDSLSLMIEIIYGNIIIESRNLFIVNSNGDLGSTSITKIRFRDVIDSLFSKREEKKITELRAERARLKELLKKKTNKNDYSGDNIINKFKFLSILFGVSYILDCVLFFICGFFSFSIAKILFLLIPASIFLTIYVESKVKNFFSRAKKRS